MTPEELLAGIRDADAHRGGIRGLRLFVLERGLARALRAEVLRLCEVERSSDVHEREHVTHWTQPHGAVRQFSLYNRSGQCDDFRDDHDLSCQGKRFHSALAYPGLARWSASLPHLINLRVNLLGPGAGLAQHEEHSLFALPGGRAAIRARFHLPVVTSPRARMMLDGIACRFVPRTIYYFNQGCVHAAENPAGTARVHLVWDQLLTREVFDLMFGAAPAPAGWQRLMGEQRSLRVLERYALARYTRMPPQVTPWEAERVVFSPAQ
jgi:hypothetical protein